MFGSIKSVRIFLHRLGRHAGPLPEPLRLAMDGGNILHDNLDVTAPRGVEKIAQLPPGSIELPMVLGQNRRTRLAAHHVVAPHLGHDRGRVAPRADGEFPQVGDPPQDFDLSCQAARSSRSRSGPNAPTSAFRAAGRTPSASVARPPRISGRWNNPTCSAAARAPGQTPCPATGWYSRSRPSRSGCCRSPARGRPGPRTGRLRHPGVDHPLHARMHQLGTIEQVDHRLLDAPPANQVIPGREPDVGLPDLADREDAGVDAAHGLVAETGRRLVMGDHRHADLFQVGEVADLDLEMPRDDVAGRVPSGKGRGGRISPSA